MYGGENIRGPQNEAVPHPPLNVGLHVISADPQEPGGEELHEAQESLSLYPHNFHGAESVMEHGYTHCGTTQY